VRARFAHAGWAPGAAPAPGGATASFSWAHDPDVAWAVGVHEHEGVRYLIKEPYERLLWTMAIPVLIDAAGADGGPDGDAVRAIEHEIGARLAVAERAGWRVEGLFDTARAPAPAGTPAGSPAPAG
jgi:hypothetical protein